MKEEITKEQIDVVVTCLKDLPIHVGKALNETAEIIEEIFAENIELRNQLASRQLHDYQSLDDLVAELPARFCTPPFFDGEHVRLKGRPEITGVVERVSITYLMGKPTVVCSVKTSLSPSLVTFAASELESLPEACDQKQ
ncbi:hypothetical protein JHT54_005097 [Salmonella enterica]|nr:hypothetical protein [Salmonella enterica]EHK4302333.1 hypothetical protein [Salmonella enterica]EHK4316800.1 hypothetical protein [Salmonella enterica]EHK4321747.1 hypothetical protein [Salmonella enterica]